MLFSCSKQWLWFLIHTDVFPDVSAFSICHLCHLPAKMMVFPGFNDIALRSLTLTHRRKGKSARSGAPDVKAQLCASPGLGKRFWRAATGTGVVRGGAFPEWRPRMCRLGASNPAEVGKRLTDGSWHASQMGNRYGIEGLCTFQHHFSDPWPIQLAADVCSHTSTGNDA